MDGIIILQEALWDVGLLAAASLLPFLVLYLFQRIGVWALYRLGGHKTFLAFSWVGVPAHELAHAAMALLFAHQVIDIKLLETDHVVKQLGWVRHRWDPMSLYQSGGLFLIGLAPLVLGGGLIWLGVGQLVPTHELLLAGVAQQAQAFQQLQTPWAFLQAGAWANLELLDLLLAQDNLQAWSFWVFIYLGGSVALHMRPSTPDWLGSLTGLVYVVGGLFLARAGLGYIGFSAEHLRATFHLGAAWMGALLTLAAAVAGVLVGVLLLGLLFAQLPDTIGDETT